MRLFTLDQYRQILRDSGASDTLQLKLLHYYAKHLEQEGLSPVQRARAMRTQLRELAENGRVLLVEGGRDCDGVQYWGRVREIDATLKAYETAVYWIEYSADGPCWFSLERVSERHTIERGSRDLVLEAFEDGHPHLLVP